MNVPSFSVPCILLCLACCFPGPATFAQSTSPRSTPALSPNAPVTGVSQSVRTFRIQGRDRLFEEVTEHLSPQFTAMRWLRSQNVWLCEVTLHNTGARPVTGRVLLVSASWTGTSGPWDPDNATDAPSSEPRYWDLTDSLPETSLSPGGTTRPHRIALGRQGNEAPTLRTRVYLERRESLAQALALTRTLTDVGHALPETMVEEWGPQGRRQLVSEPGAGYLTLGGIPGAYRWAFSKAGHLSAWRTATLSQATTWIPTPRLTPVGPHAAWTFSDQSAVLDMEADLRVQVPAAPALNGQAARLTRIHPQALPLALPVGWSPQTTFALDLPAPTPTPVRIEVAPREPLATQQQGVVVRLDTNALAWVVVESSSPPVGNRLVLETSESGILAWVLPDAPPTAPTVVAVGQPLTSASPAPVTRFTVTGSVVPPVALASTLPQEVTAEARLSVVAGDGSVPSGTLLAAEILERYTLSDGSVQQPPPYLAFITVFRPAGSTNTAPAEARVPLRPVRLLPGTELIEASLTASIIASPEPPQQLVSPQSSPSAQDGLTVVATPGRLVEPRLIQLKVLNAPQSAPDWLATLGHPSGLARSELMSVFELAAGFARKEERVDLQPSEAPPEGTYVVARVWHQGAATGLEPVARYRSSSGAWSVQSQASESGLRGLDRSGQFVLIRSSHPLGLVSGRVLVESGHPAEGIRVTLPGQPWTALTDDQGRFQLLAPVGSHFVEFIAPGSGRHLRREFSMPASLVTQELDLVETEAAPFVVETIPPDETTEVPLLTQIQIRFSEPVVPPSATPPLVLLDPLSNAVPARLEWLDRSQTAHLTPEAPLQPGTAYRVHLSQALSDAAGNGITGGREFGFATVAETPRRLAGAQLISTAPDTSGLVQVIGSVGMAFPRQPVLFINDSTGHTTTLLAQGDGSFTNSIPATVQDRLRIVLIDPQGERTEIPVGRQLFPDGSVALYSEGGRFTNRNASLSVILDVPPGAISGRTRFKVTPHLPDELPTLIGPVPAEEATAFGAFDLEVEGDPVRGRLRVEIQPDRSLLQPPPGKTLDDLTLYAATPRTLADAGVLGEDTSPVFQFQSLLRPLSQPGLALPPTPTASRRTQSPDTPPRPTDGRHPLGAFFGGFYALIDPVGARHLLFGSVYYSETEIFGHTASALFVGGRDVIPGTQVRVGGAVVRARARSTANSRPFSLQPGELVVISDADGTFVFLVPEQGPSGGHSLIATHPNFPRQFGTGSAVRVDPLYPNAASSVLFDRARVPDDAPPSISVFHSPALPPAGTDAAVRVEASDDAGPATVTLTVDHVLPAASLASAVQRQPGVWDVRASARSKVVLRVRAVDSTGNATEQMYPILFGEPPVPPRPPNDPSGPYVLYSNPDEGALGVNPLQSIDLHFNEWIDPQVLQTPATYFTLSPSAPHLFADFLDDPKGIRLSLGGLRDNTEYTLTVQGLRDLNGQIFDQNPATNSPPAEPFRLRFRTAPNLLASLPGIDEGGGAVLLGSHAYVLDRRGPSILRYDLTVPTQPRLVGERILPGPPRAITLVRDYEFTLGFATPAQPSDRPGTVQKSDLLVVAGKTSGASLGYVRVFDLRKEFTQFPAIGVANLSLDPTAVLGRLQWSAPYLVLPENSLAAPQIHVFNLQSLLLADAYRALDRPTLLGLPQDSTPGLDANSDGDYVDVDDRLPLVGRDAIQFVAGGVEVLSLNPNRSGPRGVYQLRESGRFITDTALDGRSGQVVALTGPGRDVLVQIRGFPLETNILNRPTAIRSYVIGQSSPDTLVPTVISNAFSLEFPGWYPKRALFVNAGVQRLLVLNLISLDSQTNSLRVIDASRPDALFELNEIPFPAADYGLLQGAELDPSGRIVLSTAKANTQDLIVLDPNLLQLPSPSSGPHPAIIGRMNGAGAGVTPFALGPQGVNVASLRDRSLVSQGAPSLRFLPAGTNTFNAVRTADPQERRRKLRDLPEPDALPVAGSFTNTTLLPNNPAFVWYLFAEAPGGAGPQMDAALVSLDPDGNPVQGTNTLLPSFLMRVPLHRLAHDPALEAFNAYLSDPIVLMPDWASTPDIQRFRGSLQILRAGTRIRTGLPESLAGNAVLGPFAGRGAFVPNPPPNAAPVRFGVSQSRPVSVLSPSLTVSDPIFLRTTVDRLNGRACPGSAWLEFEHALDAEISIRIDGQPLRNVSDEHGNPIAVFTDVPLPAGRHRILLDAAMVPNPGNHRVEVLGTRFAQLAPSVTLTVEATLEHEVELHQSFPIGHTIIQGVDLWDGHLGHSAQDISIPGRRLSLTLGRTYSSAGDSSAGPLGAGWTHSYNIRLIHQVPCGVFTVIGGEGSGNAFTDPNPNPAKAALYLPLLPPNLDAANLDFFKPQIGYHSVLIRDRTRPESLWFFTKEGIRYDFVSEGALTSSSQTVFTLRSIREPNGNSLSLDYLDGDTDPSTLDSVTERDALGQLPKRAFLFEYRRIAGESRITTLRGFNHQGSRDLLGLEIRYTYDTDGNLTNVTRIGTSPETTRSESYRYTPGTGPSGHNLLEYTGPNGTITRYAYATDPTGTDNSYTSQGTLLPGIPPHEVVTNVTHVGDARPGFVATATPSYGFRYDFPGFRRYVADPRPTDSLGNAIPETEYTLNAYGATTRVRAPLGQESEMRWATDHLDGSVLNESGAPVRDVLMTWRRDPEGQEQFFEYQDGRGNLTRQRTVFSASSYRPVTDRLGNPVTEIIRSAAFHPLFNQATNTVDAEGASTTYLLDPRNGNLLQTLDAEGYKTHYAYRPDGDLRERTDPRGFTTAYLDYDPYGNPRRIRDALGNETITDYDERGRPIESQDTFKHHTQTIYDSLDRKVVERRLNDLSGLASGPGSHTTNHYDAAGLLIESISPLGLVSRTFYDALNRPVRAQQLHIPQAEGPPITYTTLNAYDLAGNLISETDARGVVRIHAYDALNRRIRTSLQGPLGGPSNGSGLLAGLAYDRAGNLTNEVNMHGLSTGHVLDALYRIVETHLPLPGAIITHQFDREGNKTRTTDPEGQTTLLEYDRLYRLRKTTDAEGRVSEFLYDAANNATNSVVQPAGLVTTQTYDAAQREITHTVTGPGLPPAGYTTSTVYDDALNQVTTTNPRGFATRIRKDGLDRVAESTVDPGGLNLVTRQTFNPAGNVLTVSDPEGDDIDQTQEFDTLGRVLRRKLVRTASDATEVVELFEYDPDGHLTRTVDRRGFEKRMQYDNLGRPRLIERREPISTGGSWIPLMATAYDDQRRITTLSDARGHATVSRQDELGRPYAVTDPLGGITLTEYGPINIRARVDRNGRRTSFTYDRLHRLLTQTDHDTNGMARSVAAMEYLDTQRQVRLTDPRGLVSTAEHDALGRTLRLERSGPDLAVRYGANPILLESREYDGNGNLVRQTDAQGVTTEFEYDAADRMTRLIEAAGTPAAAATVTRYDRVGNVLAIKDPRPTGLDFDVRHTYDARYRRIATENALGNTTRFRFDAGDLLIELTEPLGHTTRYEYDEAGALLAVDETPRATAGDAGITRYRYDPAGNLIAQQDANGALLTKAYDALNRVTNLLHHTSPGTLGATIRRTGPFGGGLPLSWSFAYDPEGNQTRVVDPRGQITELAYDHLDRTVLHRFSAHAETNTAGQPLAFQPLAIHLVHDPNGNPTEIREEKQAPGGPVTDRTVMTYDGLDRLISLQRFDHDDPAGRALQFAYDRVGNRTNLVDADGRITATEFDRRHRLAAVTLDPTGPQALQAAYSWEPDNLLRRIEYPGGTVSLRAYDSADRLISLTNASAGGVTPLSTFTYAYDANGNRTGQSEFQPGSAFGAESTSYAYDRLNRLTRVAYGNAAAITNTYSPNGNRLTEQGIHPVTGSPVHRAYHYQRFPARAATTYDHVNLLTRIEDLADPARSVDYDYDANLNQIARTQAGIRHEFRYDARDQLIEAKLPSKTIRFDYNADRLRAKKLIVGGEETRYLHDHATVVLEYGNAARQHATLRKYDYGQSLLALGIPSGASVLERQFYLTDGLQSVVGLVDPLGSLEDQYRYDAWGHVRTRLGTNDNPRLYTGHFFDEETGLHYFRARYYDDEQGRFISADPNLGQPETPSSLHRYLYANANPLRFTDPTGFASESGDPTDRWIRETREMLRGMDQRLESDVAALGPGSLATYRDGQKAAEELQRMGEERERMLQEAGLTEADLRNPVMADRARWGLTLLKRDLVAWSVEGDGGTWRAVAAGIVHFAATLVVAPFELGAGLGTLSGKRDVGAEVTAGDWIAAGADALALAGGAAKVGKIGLTEIAEQAAKASAQRALRGAVIGEARRTLGREVGTAAKLIDDAPKRLAADREWYQIQKQLDESMREASLLRRAQNRFRSVEPHAYRERTAEVGRLLSPNRIDQELADLYVNQMLRDHGAKLARIDALTRDLVRNAGRRELDDILERLHTEVPFEIRRANQLPADLPGYGRSPFTGRGQGGYNPVRYSEIEGKLFIDTDLVTATRRGNQAAAKEFAGQFLHDSAAIPLLRRYGKRNTPVVVFNNIIQVPGKGFRPQGQHLTHYFDEALGRYLHAYRALHPTGP